MKFRNTLHKPFQEICLNSFRANNRVCGVSNSFSISRFSTNASVRNCMYQSTCNAKKIINCLNHSTTSLEPYQPKRFSHHSAPADTGDAAAPNKKSSVPVTVLDIKKMYKDKKPIVVCFYLIMFIRKNGFDLLTFCFLRF